MRRLLPWMPLLVVVLSGAWLASRATQPSPSRPYDLETFSRLPVSAEGRVKPLDTVARNSLMILSGRQELHHEGQTYPAIRWYLDAVARPQEAAAYRVFRVDDPSVLALLDRPGEPSVRLSFDELSPHRRVINEQAVLASQVRSRFRNAYQKHLLELFQRMQLYLELQMTHRPYLIPPLAEGEQWAPLADQVMRPHGDGSLHPAARSLALIFSAYQQEDPALFNQTLGAYSEVVTARLPRSVNKADFEVFFNRFAPFYHASALYVFAFLLGCAGFVLRQAGGGQWSGALTRSAFWLLVFTLLIHTFGLASRVYLQGRPPVTNLYSSAVFIGWVCVGLALVVERFSRLGLASIAAAVVGFITLVIAHHLGGDGDTMEMMQAVLDSNFWLATHVVTITIGYSAAFLAGVLAIAYILIGAFTPWLTDRLARELTRMVYGVVCFTLLFSFVGTVLGGIWADQSWGRFWGWDPKENGAALIVLLSAIILHARWGGMIRQRGMMVLAVGGNIVTSWSWFGTNMLGVGLHSYGFMDSAMFWLATFIVSQLTIMSVGLLPLRFWRSFADPAPQGVRPANSPPRRRRPTPAPLPSPDA